MVKSAAKLVSKTESKDSNFNAVTIFPVDNSPGSNPNSSASAYLTAGAIWAITYLLLSSSIPHTLL